MTKRKIILVPDEILKKKSEKIEKLTSKEKQWADDLFETMYKNNGIGLAAVQVGVLRRMIVIDVSKKDEEKKPLCLINPIIKSFFVFRLSSSKKSNFFEFLLLSLFFI